MSTYGPLLAASVEQLGDVVERLPLGVILVSGATSEIVYVNVAARRMLHPVPLRRGSGVPDPWAEFSLPAYVARLFESNVIPDTEVSQGDNTFLVKGIPPRTSNIGAVVIEDISERERRRRAEREFVANAAHELITPLTGLVSAAHVLETGAKEVPEDRDRFVAHIAEEADRLTRIARSLLVLARAQSGEEPPRLETLTLLPILEECVAAVDGTAKHFAVVCRPGLAVLVDADLLEQALTNLFTNALTHDPADRVKVAAEQLPSNRVEIRVGEGQPIADSNEADRGRRFSTTTGRDAGFGLGLSIATQSIEVMGGKLAVRETSGGGFVVRITVPAGRVSDG